MQLFSQLQSTYRAYVADYFRLRDLWKLSLPASLHSNIGDVISAKGMFQHIKDIIPTRENKNFRFRVFGLDP